MPLSTFFSILIILSITISFRVLFYILAMTTTAVISNSFSVFLTKSSLYIDYCSNFFSLAITFLMSLNRCFCFVSKNWNSKIFDGKNVIVPIVLSAVVSVSGAVICILTSSIIRVLYPGLGYIDMGSDTGFKVLINRIFFVFPMGSVICYVVLFYVLRKQNRQVLTKTSNRSKGEQKVFVQLLITTVLYGIMSTLYEVLNLVNWSDTALQLTFISVFSVLNYLPEISLPLLLICNSVQIRKKVSSWIAPKSDRTIVTEQAKTTTTTL
ncbi:hypothetical protein GCK72_020247 [Caenorhabditis remanei]|uniref:Serpentine receptor class gamma n=1 Tax=Caenorhabditis remanei TaxID=31234 RepID=A0A6A5GF02_CAERE|nr:hypothetical protein GCK72_020247 [Caenorhabditis remanei]KAF1753690.1 hypothetical protein GCK72_020247 [Caenorhabditis remanei]